MLMVNHQANSAYLDWFVFAAYLNRNAKPQALPILAGNKPQGNRAPHFCHIIPFPLFSFIFDSVLNICLCSQIILFYSLVAQTAMNLPTMQET